jgi:hypothetical protein
MAHLPNPNTNHTSYNHVPGTNNSEVLLGTADWTSMGRTSDWIEGKGGDDELHGRWGDDWLDGGSGKDKLWGDTGQDVQIGGAGSDRFYVAWDMGEDELLDFTIKGKEHYGPATYSSSDTDKLVVNSRLVSNDDIATLIEGASRGEGLDATSVDTAAERQLIEKWLGGDYNETTDTMVDWGFYDPNSKKAAGYATFETQWEWLTPSGSNDAVLHLYSNEWVDLATDVDWRGYNTDGTPYTEADMTDYVTFVGWGGQEPALSKQIIDENQIHYSLV